ncbi:MAG: hypothetical protein Q6363_003465 [Candidatus Njordarchaeota archaeon]
MESKEINKKLDDISRTLKSLQRMLRYFLGTYSRYVGKAAEQLTASIIEKIKDLGGVKIDGDTIEPINIVSKNLRAKDYEIDLLGADKNNNIWIIETTTYPIFDEKIADKIYNRIKRWYDRNKQKPCFILFAYGGIDKGLYDMLKRKLNNICNKVIILDKIRSRKLLSLLDKK